MRIAGDLFLFAAIAIALCVLIFILHASKIRFGVTKSQLHLLAGPSLVLLVIAVFPHFGAPHFRYTGSDPNHHIWNLGWPLATCIYDAAHPPHFFVGPVAYLYAFAAIAGLSVAYAVIVAWNNRQLLRHSTRTGQYAVPDSSHQDSTAPRHA